MALNDDEIISLYFSRDESAIQKTDEKYGSLCRSVSLRIVGDSSDCEECVWDSYLKTWNAIPPKRPDSLAAFLTSIVRNISLDKYRAVHASKRTAQLVSLDELADVIPDDMQNDSELDAEQNRVLNECLNDFLKSLKPEQRVAFMRRYFLGESVADVAKRLGVTANSMGVTLLRLRKRLKARLEKEDVFKYCKKEERL